MELPLTVLSIILTAALLCCFSYQLLLFVSAYLRRPKQLPAPSAGQGKYAFLLAARNEEGVIGDLIESIRGLDYPADRVGIFVVADNCTDHTAQAARAAGAAVYQRQNARLVGKGYALDFLIRRMMEDGSFGDYDGFLIFDADNLLAPDYLTEMDKVFRAGYPVVTSYRNSTNPTASWISSGNAVTFLRESQFLNRGRMRLGSACAVSGTGYLLSRELLEGFGGWPFHLLTEDVEFTAYCTIHEIRVGYCESAMFYDEQTTRFMDSYRQRLRWVRGSFQVYRKYGTALLRGAFTKSRFADRLSCFDLLMASMPAFFLMVFELLSLAVCTVVGLAAHLNVLPVLPAFLRFLANTYLGLAGMGLFVLATECRKYPLSLRQLVRAVITYPLFLFTYIPVTLHAACFFKPVEWTPIVHTGARQVH